MNSYQFALIDKQTAYLGVGLKSIVRSWAELERARGIAIGYVNYEGDLYFGIFRQLKKVPLRSLTDSTSFQLKAVRGESFASYRRKINKIKRHLAIGDIYQANYTYQLSAKTNATPNQLLYQFTRRQPTPYGALINTPEVKLVSNSPELGVSIDGQLVECRPMKGTAARRLPKSVLLNSTKDQAELDMITDVVRNDLAQFAIPGSVVVKQRRQIVGYNTVWQAQSVIQAKRPKTVDTLQIIRAILPFASVTGAPKLRAVEILKQLEPAPRGVYCGAIGYIADRSKAEFNVAIRTAVLQRGQLQYGVGGGITLDSDAKREYQETITKAKMLEWEPVVR